jgi:hypothetical protein
MPGLSFAMNRPTAWRTWVPEIIGQKDLKTGRHCLSCQIFRIGFMENVRGTGRASDTPEHSPADLVRAASRVNGTPFV